MVINDEERSELGLGKASMFSGIETLALPAQQAGAVNLRGLAWGALLTAMGAFSVHSPEPVQVERVATQSVSAPSLEPFFVKSLFGLAKLYFMPAHPGVICAEVVPGVNAWLAGAVGNHPDGFYVLDGRTRALLHVCSGNGEKLVVVSAGQLQVFDIQHTANLVVEGLRGLERRVGPELPAPSIELPQGAPGWLSELLNRQLGSDLSFGRAGAASVLLRNSPVAVLETVRAASAKANGIESLLAGEFRAPTGPRDAARAWLTQLDEPVLSELDSLSVASATALLDDLMEVEEVLSAETDSAADAAIILELLHRREIMEGIAELLALAGRGGDLRKTLEGFDTLGRNKITLLASPPQIAEDEWLRATSWQHPDAWWAQIVGAR